jgi:hypothetical protein
MLKGKAAIMATVILAVMAGAGPALAQTPGDIAKAPLSAMLQAAMLEGVRTQVIFSADVKVQPMLHFPPQRGDNGRVCGEVIENTPEGERVRAFYASYTRSGRVLIRLEDMRLADYLAQDKVFRNCGPRL